MFIKSSYEVNGIDFSVMLAKVSYIGTKDIKVTVSFDLNETQDYYDTEEINEVLESIPNSCLVLVEKALGDLDKSDVEEKNDFHVYRVQLRVSSMKIARFYLISQYEFDKELIEDIFSNILGTSNNIEVKRSYCYAVRLGSKEKYNKICFKITSHSKYFIKEIIRYTLGLLFILAVLSLLMNIVSIYTDILAPRMRIILEASGII